MLWVKLACFLRQLQSAIQISLVFRIIPSEVIGCGNEILIQIQKLLVVFVGLCRLPFQVMENSQKHIRRNRAWILLNDFLILFNGLVELQLGSISIAKK